MVKILKEREHVKRSQRKRKNKNSTQLILFERPMIYVGGKNK